MAHKQTSGLIALWLSYADTASKDLHQIKTDLDFTPLADLTCSLDYIFTYDNYTQKKPLGSKTGFKHSLIADISYVDERFSLGAHDRIETGESG